MFDPRCKECPYPEDASIYYLVTNKDDDTVLKWITLIKI